MTPIDRPSTPRPMMRAELEADLPPPLVVAHARDRIRAMNRSANRRVAVLDDDPTGSQVVHDVPILTRWEDEDLRWAMEHPAGTFFVLTNTRSLAGTEARQLITELATRIEQIADEVGTRVSFLSRGDSTLRGHYPLETDALAEVATLRGNPYDALLLIPAYLDAGRVTVDEVHYARDGEQFVPVGSTDYATDHAFGYQSSSLRDWIREKAGPAVEVRQLSLPDIRHGGVDRITELLLAAREGSVVIVNALAESDLEVVALAMAQAEETGWRAVARVGPSFVPVRAAITRRSPLQPAEIFAAQTRGRGLIVVGSHVDLTTRQVRELETLPGIHPILVDVAAVATEGRATELARCAAQIDAAPAGCDLLLITSRERVQIAAGEASLTLSQQVSAVLVDLVRHVVGSLDIAWVVAKGGITSHDVAAHGLQIGRAVVLGQLFDGLVSVWRAETAGEPAVSGLPFVVFAGNVGDEFTLRESVSLLRAGLHQSTPELDRPRGPEISTNR